MAKPAWAAKKLKNLEERSSGGGDFYEWKDGANILRILPSWKGNDEQFYLEDALHYRVGPENAVLKCRRVLLNKPCAICEEADKLFKAGDKDGSREIRAKSRYYANAIDLNDPKSGVKTLAFGASVLKAILTFLVDEDDEWGEWWNEKGRYDFKVVKKGEKMQTEYTVFPVRKFVDVKTAAVKPRDLEALASKIPSYEEGAAALAGEEFSGTTEEEDEEKPEEAEEETEAEEEEEEKPVRKGKAKKVEEEDAEEEPEAEEAEEDAEEDAEEPEEDAEEDAEEPEEEASEEEPPACFKDPNEHNPADSVCKDCSFFDACGKAVKKKIASEPKKYKDAPLAKVGKKSVEEELRGAVKKTAPAIHKKKGSRK